MSLIRFVFNMMTYGKSKDLLKRTQSDKVLRDKAFKIASDGYQKGLDSKVYKFFDTKFTLRNKSSGSGVDTEPNYQLADELHRQING